jgi:hypothetical protein
MNHYQSSKIRPLSFVYNFVIVYKERMSQMSLLKIYTHLIHRDKDSSNKKVYLLIIINKNMELWGIEPQAS